MNDLIRNEFVVVKFLLLKKCVGQTNSIKEPNKVNFKNMYNIIIIKISCNMLEVWMSNKSGSNKFNIKT